MYTVFSTAVLPFFPALFVSRLILPHVIFPHYLPGQRMLTRCWLQVTVTEKNYVRLCSLREEASKATRPQVGQISVKERRRQLYLLGLRLSLASLGLRFP